MSDRLVRVDSKECSKKMQAEKLEMVLKADLRYRAVLGAERDQGSLRMLDQTKTFGSFFHDDYTVTVWKVGVER